MSVRYSGDTEIRLGFDPKRRVYRGTVVDPYLRFWGEVSLGRSKSEPTSSEAYDDAARRLVELAERWARRQTEGSSKREKRRFMTLRKRGRIAVMRVFHSPCPLEDL